MVIHYKALNTGIDKIFSSFKKTQVQQRIKKAEKDGLDFCISDSEKSINEFYSLHLLTRKKLGVPIQPKKFFYNFYEKIIHKGLGFVVIVYLKGKPIGAGIFAGFGSIITYKYSASDPALIKLHPNHLMLWNAIKESLKRGFKIFNFGKTDIKNIGLREFKSGWGSVEEPLYYSYYPKAPSEGKLKLINDKFVSPIIKSAPKIVCRIIGEIAYKYFPSL
jgi:lipid II:glycine glycyltransferase (peptidoglycan interpeptide bridge formation enzyme)